MRTSSDRVILHLQIARTLRSISQGIAIVDLTLYLRDLNWSATAIGGVLSAAGITGAGLILLVGIISDKLGRKPFLLFYETLVALATLVMIMTSNPIFLTVIILITGLGRGQNGAAGPFTPAEQAWMASCVPLHLRARVFSTNTALGYFGMAAGSLLAGATSLWNRAFPGASSFYPLFFLMFLSAIASMIVVATAPSGIGPCRKDANVEEKALRSSSLSLSKERTIRRQENKSIAKLAVVNLFNGLAAGFIGPMISYWFATRFGVSSSEIGLTLALSFVFAGGSSVVTGIISQRFGLVRSVVWFRLAGIVLILILPLMPFYWLASSMYIIRSALSRGTQGARSALSSSLTRDERRGFSVSMNSLAVRLASAVGPTLSGYMLDIDILTLPFFIAGSLQLLSTILYGKLFRDYDLPPQNS
ncbi:MFS transporter [Desulfosporosinus sp. FKA]|uniref:MFS transporter n=1 Tax=Desulfosporosinus sp. FKA TaxID=1969834 RepID=UPI000B49C26E|nr:MFS transporter [Desulfosporosinus sp. FKA]